MKKTAKRHLHKRSPHHYNEIVGSFKSLFLNKISLIIITALVLSGIGLAATYFLTQKTSITPETSSAPEDTDLPVSELVEGEISRIEDNLLTLKVSDEEEMEIRIATGAAILKQKRFSPNSIGTVPATASAQAGNPVSVSAIRNAEGNLETNMIVILDPEIE